MTNQPNVPPINADLQTRIDRLVDGELTIPETQKLVEQLDAEPSHWRVCAATYMEAAALKTEFRALLDPALEPAIQNEAPANHPQKRSPIFSPLLSLVLTAVVAISIGSAGTAFWLQKNLPQQPVLTKIKPQPKITLPPQPSTPTLLTIKIREKNGELQETFPIAFLKQLNKNQQATFEEPVVTEYVQRIWLQRGWEVKGHRKMIDMEFDNGQKLCFPVDWIQRQHVGQAIH